MIDWIKKNVKVGKKFTVYDVQQKTGINHNRIRSVIKWLSYFGFVERLPEEKWKKARIIRRDTVVVRRMSPTYVLVKEI